MQKGAKKYKRMQSVHICAKGAKKCKRIQSGTKKCKKDANECIKSRFVFISATVEASAKKCKIVQKSANDCLKSRSC